MYPVPSLPPLSRRQWALRLAALGLAPGLLTPALAHEEGEGAAHHEHGHGRSQLAAGAAFAPDGGLWAVQLNAAGLLQLLRSQAATPGQWLAPQLLDTGDDAIAADGESRPEIAFGPNGWVVISYTQPLPKPYTGMIRMLRSSDGGASFTPPFTVHQDRQEITHRFASIAFDADGALHTLWIDKRDQPPKGSGIAYDGAAVYRNVSHDGGASFGRDLLLAAHTCECCRIALARGADGHLRALWRHVFDGQIRDHAFAAVTDAVPAQLTRATFDNWHIKACPHHGPGLAMAERGEFHAVWFGVRKLDGQDRGAVRYVRLSASGAPIAQTERALPDERAEHADVLAHGAQVAVVWRSTDGATTRLRAWLSRDGGQHFELRELAQTTGENDHPRLAQAGARASVVWRTAQETQVHALNF